MKPVTILADYKAIRVLIRAFDSFLAVNPNDEDAKRMRQMSIEAGAIMEIEAMMEILLEDDGVKEDCKECPAKDECHPPDTKVN